MVQQEYVENMKKQSNVWPEGEEGRGCSWSVTPYIV
jgi:hypothetical protein